MFEIATMSARGQIIIPKKLREKIGALETTVFVTAAIDENTIALRRLSSEEWMQKFEEIRASTKKMSQKEVAHEIAEARKELRAKSHH